MEERINIHCDFLNSVKDSSNFINNIIVIAPQLSPLVGENFFLQVPKHIHIREEKVREAALRYPLSDIDRCSFVINFNDRRAERLNDKIGLEFIRIGKLMIDDDKKINPAFPKEDHDHHARIDQTQRLWRNFDK